MKINGLMHVKLDVKDLERSEHFYRTLLGFKEIVRLTTLNGKGVIVQLSPTGWSPGVELWFEHSREVAPPTECHVAFDVDDVRAWVERLREEGVQVAEEPFEDRGEAIAFVRDPDGYLIEFCQSLIPPGPERPPR